MALISCPDCGATVSDTAPSCPHCGCPLKPVQAAPANPPQPKPYVQPAPAPKASASAKETLDKLADKYDLLYLIGGIIFAVAALFQFIAFVSNFFNYYGHFYFWFGQLHSVVLILAWLVAAVLLLFKYYIVKQKEKEK